MSFSWSTFALQAVNFLVLVWLLRRFLLNPVRSIIARRKEEISRALAEAKGAAEKAEKAREGFESRQREIETERQRTLEEARADLADERSKMLEATRAEVENLKSSALKRIDEERDAAGREVFEQSVQIAVRLSETLLRELEFPRVDDLFLRRVLDHIEQLSNHKRSALLGSATRDGGRLVVTTAHALDPDEQQKWRSALREKLIDLREVSFLTDDQLIAGAELQFPHALLRFSWRDSLAAAQRVLVL
jgi:F-type H+-transporting ATPase subunit b